MTQWLQFLFLLSFSSLLLAQGADHFQMSEQLKAKRMLQNYSQAPASEEMYHSMERYHNYKSHIMHLETARAYLQNRTPDKQSLLQKNAALAVYLTEEIEEFFLFEETITRWAFSYDNEGNNTKIEQFAWNTFPRGWINERLETFTYDGLTEPAERFFHLWEEEAYKLYEKSEYDYDTNLNMLEDYRLTWNDPDWDPQALFTWSYNEGDNILEYAWQSWGGSDWVDFIGESYTYDESGRLQEYLATWSGQNSSLNTYTYDDENGIVEVLGQDWSGVSWVNSFRETNTLDETGNFSEMILEYWGGADWDSGSRTTFTYDENNNMTKSLVYNADDINTYRTSNTYDEYLNNIESLEESNWDGEGWNVVRKLTRTYEPLVSSIDDGGIATVNGFKVKQNYPNPFNPSTTIEFNLPQKEYAKIIIYNMLGQKINTLLSAELNPGSYSYEWNAADQPSGIYTYHVQAGDFKEVKKMILLK